MHYTYWELIFFFYFYGVLGWLASAAVVSLVNGRFINHGILNGPFMPSVATAITLSVWLVRDESAFAPGRYTLCLFVCMASYGVSRRIVDRLTGRELPERLLGLFRPCGRFARIAMHLTLALCAFGVISLLHPFVLMLSAIMLRSVLVIVDLVLTLLFAVDLAATDVALRSTRREQSNFGRQTTQGLQQTRNAWGNRVAQALRNRLYRTYPEMQVNAAIHGGMGTPDANRVFAQGYGLTKMFWVFMICALVGDIVETFYCGLVNHQWMSRSSFLYGPFSAVWGGGAMLGVALLEPFAKKNNLWIFLGGFFMGGAYEYLCSVFTEKVFGKVFWDYSDMPLNIGGRTNVLFMCFWGIAAVVLIRLLYPRLSDLIEKIPPLPGTLITWVLLVVMALNAALSVLALVRYNERAKDPVAYNQVERFLDQNYPDQMIEEHWKNMVDSRTEFCQIV